MMHSLFFNPTTVFLRRLSSLFHHARDWTPGSVYALAAPRIDDGHDSQTPWAPLAERVIDDVVALRACASLRAELLCQRHHINICASRPPTRNAVTHVPVHTSVASFSPRSFSITISDAMQGVKRVMVTSDTMI